MTTIPLKEIDRQYRVLRQTLSMHAMLRDEFSWKAKASDILLLACSVVFCATTFASDDLYTFFGLVPNISRVILGIASVVAFILSLMLMVVDFKGQAALHRQAVERWSQVLAKYRKHRNDDGTWPEEVRAELDFGYWEADRNSVKIPEQRFNRLKSRHLRKVAVSELQSSYPGCPRPFLMLLLRFQDTKKALGGVHTDK
jgi:hypothetical protein